MLLFLISQQIRPLWEISDKLMYIPLTDVVNYANILVTSKIVGNSKETSGNGKLAGSELIIKQQQVAINKLLAGTNS